MGHKPRKHKSSRQKAYSGASPRRKSKSSRKPLFLGLIFCIAVASIVIYSVTTKGGDDVGADQNLSENVLESNIVLLKTSMGNITIESMMACQ
jgi:hypothetical protein